MNQTHIAVLLVIVIVMLGGVMLMVADYSNQVREYKEILKEEGCMGWLETITGRNTDFGFNFSVNRT